MTEMKDPAAPDEAGAPEAVGSTAVKRPPRKRTAKPDPLIAESVELALAALKEEFPDEEIGEHTGVTTDDERVMTHRFAGAKRGYRGWQWYATLARAPRAKSVTVCELGLLPSDDSVLAPPWVPWSERIRPEDTAEQSQAEDSDGEGVEDSDAPAESAGQAADSASDADDAPHTAAADEGSAADDSDDDDEAEPTAAEIEASVAVKRSPRRRRYRTRSAT